MKKLLIVFALCIPLNTSGKVSTKEQWIKYYLRPCKTVPYNFVCKEKLERAITRMNHYAPMIFYQLDEMDLPGFLAIIPIMESHYSNRAVSKVNGKPFALGIWQVSWVNFKEYFRRTSLTDLSKHEIIRSKIWRNPEFNTHLATWILNGYHKKYKNWQHTLYAYNAGSTAVDAWLKNKEALPEQTQNFYNQFLALYDIVKNQEHYGIEAEDKTTYYSYVLKNKLKATSKWFN